MSAALHIVGWVLYWAAAIYTLLLLARMVFDWVRFFAQGWQPPQWLLPILNLLYGATDPPLRFLRRYIPPLRLGEGFALDVGFIVLFVAVMVLQRVGLMLVYV